MKPSDKIESSARLVVFIAGILSVVSVIDVITGGRNGFTLEHVIGFGVVALGGFLIGRVSAGFTRHFDEK